MGHHPPKGRLLVFLRDVEGAVPYCISLYTSMMMGRIMGRFLVRV